MTNKRPILKCDCIDKDTLVNLKLALIYSRDKFKEMAVTARKKGDEKTASTLDEKANEMHLLIEEIRKIKPCEEFEKTEGYDAAILEYVPWLRDAISKSPDKRIMIKVRDIAKNLGPEFEKLEDASIYWRLKFALFRQGIVVEMTKTKDGSNALIMRFITPGDKLPEHIRKE